MHRPWRDFCVYRRALTPRRLLYRPSSSASSCFSFAKKESRARAPELLSLLFFAFFPSRALRADSVLSCSVRAGLSLPESARRFSRAGPFSFLPSAPSRVHCALSFFSRLSPFFRDVASFLFGLSPPPIYLLWQFVRSFYATAPPTPRARARLYPRSFRFRAPERGRKRGFPLVPRARDLLHFCVLLVGSLGGLFSRTSKIVVARGATLAARFFLLGLSRAPFIRARARALFFYFSACPCPILPLCLFLSFQVVFHELAYRRFFFVVHGLALARVSSSPFAPSNLVLVLREKFCSHDERVLKLCSEGDEEVNHACFC